MYLFYIDETGNSGTALSLEQPIHWLVALAAASSAIKQIEDEMLEIAYCYFRGKAKRPEFEFHGHNLFSGRDECRSLTAEVRIKAYRDLLQLIGRYDCKIFIRGIHKQRHQSRAAEKGYAPEHPHKLACMYLIEEIDRWLEKQSEGKEQPEYGLLVADEQKEHERDIVKSFANWRSSGTVGYRWRSIEFLIDTVHYVPSHDSWMIQLADCVAFLRNRVHRVFRTKGNDSSAYTSSDNAVIELWNSNCAKQVVSIAVWPE
jgi:hypothetical protein